MLSPLTLTLVMYPTKGRVSRKIPDFLSNRRAEIVKAIQSIQAVTAELKKEATPATRALSDLSFDRARMAPRRGRLTYNSRGPRKDKFGRTLGFVEVGGKDFGVELLKLGLVKVDDRFRCDPIASYYRMERAAKKARMGLWAKDSPVVIDAGPRSPAPPPAVAPQTRYVRVRKLPAGAIPVSAAGRWTSSVGDLWVGDFTIKRGTKASFVNEAWEHKLTINARNKGGWVQGFQVIAILYDVSGVPLTAACLTNEELARSNELFPRTVRTLEAEIVLPPQNLTRATHILLRLVRGGQRKPPR